MLRFADREQAGRLLAEKLRKYENGTDVIVLALPRGGVPVGFEVAKALRVPLDIFLVRKLGVPGHEELAMGAIASGGVRFLNEKLIRNLGIEQGDIEEATARQLEELRRREQSYRNHEEPLELEGRVAILVDDGLATGATMRAAARAVREHRPQRTVIAVPVSALDTWHDMKKEADELVCVEIPEPFFAVGQWYEDFSQTTDDEVRDLLQRAARFQQTIAA